MQKLLWIIFAVIIGIFNAVGIAAALLVIDPTISQAGAIDYEIEKNNLDALAIRRAILDCLYFDDSRKESDILFPGLDKWEESDDYPVYAFFIVGWEETDNE